MEFQRMQEIYLQNFKRYEDLINTRCPADIEKYRKGDCKITITKNGEPVNKTIKITQKTHDFKYGANIFMLDEFENEWENKAYRDMFKKYFNLATVPFYWNTLEPEQDKARYEIGSEKIYRRPAPDLCVKYCEESGILPKLHCLYYESFMPKWIPKNDEKEMRRLYEKRFKEISERYKGKMYEFEVTNETLCCHDPNWSDKSILSNTRGQVEWAFDLAQKYFEGEKLLINDAQPLPFVYKEGYLSRYFMQIEKLLLGGKCLNKIGIQNHIFRGAALKDGETFTETELQIDADMHLNPISYFKSLDMLSEFGLPLEITEVTIATLDDSKEAETLQADILEYLYTIWFSIPQMESIVYWNTVCDTAYIAANNSWNENKCRGGLFHRDFTPKEAANRLYYLFNEKWHTDLSLESGNYGEVSFRGFYGDYEAEIDGKTYSFSIHKDSDNNIEIAL